MIVVSDTSPINYLVLIETEHILEHLFGRVVVPEAVWLELQAEVTPPPVRRWAATAPAWIDVRRPTTEPEASLSRLDQGEREAICLAQELNADLLVIDERAGRDEALKLNLPVIGTLGIVERAAVRGMLEFAPTLAALRTHGFYVSLILEQHFLERDALRRTETPDAEEM